MPGTSAAAQNDVLATCGDHHAACFIRPRASVNAAHGRLFRFVLPARIHSRCLAPHSVDPSGGQLRTAGCCCNHPQTGSILNSKLSFRHHTNHRARRWHCDGYARRRAVRRKGPLSFRGIHTFARTPTGHVLVVFWAQAVNRHFRPIESNTSPHS